MTIINQFISNIPRIRSYILTEHLFFKKNYPMICMKVWVTPRKVNFDLWVRYRWVMSFLFERMEHLKD